MGGELLVRFFVVLKASISKFFLRMRNKNIDEFMTHRRMENFTLLEDYYFYR